ncbi:uncharacterized protein LOC134283013 [Saccostrea cucullata]|uniref:uncharacterized protein LOC134283013 n=1 Tax=Saccostrea cuccullata TaxID=36930 RepID=UPI002ED1D948
MTKKSGHPSKGEGCDFILEAKNRQAKSWLPSGAPKEKHWQQTCRNLDNLEKINSNIKQQLGVKDATEDSIYHTDLKNEIFQWRAELRESEYLISPHEAKDHTSLSNKPLDHELVHFSQKCKNNRLFYFQETSNQNSFKPSISLQPIFFTSIDRTNFNSIENKTKTEISAKIEEQLEDLLDLDYDAGEQNRLKWIKEIKTGTKKLYVQFYKELLELVDSLQDVRDVQDFDLQDDEVPDSASCL